MMPRTILRPDDATRLARSFRTDPIDRSRSAEPRTFGENPQPKLNGFVNDTLAVEAPPRTQQIRPDVKGNYLSAEETLEKAREEVDKARQKIREALSGSEGLSDVARSTLTLDLGHKSIARIPETLVELIKDDVERLSLSHNLLWLLPYKFSECSQLRYLNIRGNEFRDFPKAIYKLPLLEILDMSKNKLRKIPDEIRHLSSLKVLSLMHNRIEDLPYSMSDMNQLQIIKMANNPMRFRLQSIVEKKGGEMDAMQANENEREIAVTVEIKKYLRELQPVMTPADQESGDESSESTVDTPKPLKRVLSGRFPVIPSTSSADGSSDLTIRSPNVARPPPIPMKSHYRQASGTTANSLRRPGVTPVISPNNERYRSNSESVIQASAAARSKRLGTRKIIELEPVSEARARRNSHLRGLSHGSVLKMKSNMPGSGSSSSPNSPRDRRRHRFAFSRRLSSLPEQKQEAEVYRPLLESARGILYALFQLDPHVVTLINIIKRDDTRRNSLEMSHEFASMHVDALNRALEASTNNVEEEDNEGGSEPSEAKVRQACTDCIGVYTQIISQLHRNVRSIVSNGDVRYIRTFLITIYASMVEIRNACIELGITASPPHRAKTSISSSRKPSVDDRRMLQPRGTTPTPDQVQKPNNRLRADTAIQHPTLTTLKSYTHDNSPRTQTFSSRPNFGDSYGTKGPPSSNYDAYSVATTRSRSNSRATNLTLSSRSTATSVSNTPRSGESFIVPPAQLPLPRVNPLTGLSDAEEERIFEGIYIALCRAHESAQQSLPVVRRSFNRAQEKALDDNMPSPIKEMWSSLIFRCKHCLDVSEALNSRLLNMKVKDPNGGRNQREFWQTCKAFLQSFIDLVTEMREVKNLRLLPPDVIVVLRPVQRTSREAGKLIDDSPWGYLTEMTEKGPLHNPMNMSTVSGMNGTYSGTSSSSMPPPPLPLPPTAYQPQRQHPSAYQAQTQALAQAQSASSSSQPSTAVPPLSSGAAPSPATLPLPATPLSAALGPAAQATVPSTPASAYGDSFFAGNVFQRADSLLRMQEPSLGNYRSR
ncbi:MAG: hypothetical protein Q9160_008032 [Pyrenula sp. 1 TL-2023]